MLKNLLWILTWTCVGVTTASSQAPVPEVEYIAHYGSYADGVDLTGYVTYRVYVRFADTDINPALSTIFASVPDAGPENIIEITTDCGNFFQHDNGGPTVEPVNCALLNLIPSLRFDTFFTIGNLCKAAGNGALNTIGSEAPLLAAWENDNSDGLYFDGPNSILLSNTAFFRLPPDPLIFPDAQNRVLIGQFTTCGNLCMTYSIQYFNNYTGPGAASQTTLQTVCFDNPCLSLPMDSNPEVTAVPCFGDPTQVVFEAGGYENVDYKLFAGNTIGSGILDETYTNQAGGALTIDNIATGSYYMTMIDSAGCRDTSAVFTITEPLPLVFDALLNQSVLCFGDEDGAIQVNCSGGTGALEVLVNATDTYACGALISDLPCGLYAIEVTDANGCSQSENITIPCPVDLSMNLASTNIPCFDYNDGTITGTVQGGTGLITVNLILEGATIETTTGTGNVNVNFIDLGPGVYTVEATDINACEETLSFTITEPAEFSATTAVTPTDCFGSCDGGVVFTTVGGTGPFSTTVTNAAGVVQTNLSALCAGIYDWVINDNNDCNIQGEFTIVQPAELTFTLTSEDESCFGFCDGTITLANIAGENGGYNYSLSPNSGLCQAPCAGNSVTYTALCDGTYDVTVTDGLGCENVVSDIVIASPPQVIISLTVENVSCFGFSDASVTVNGSGGTGDLFSGQDGLALPQTYTGLGPNTYSYSVLDENGCSASDDVEVTEPDILTASFISTEDVSCGGACDGSLLYDVVGGTEPYFFTLLPDEEIGSVNGTIGSLCAAEYELVITDFNGCLDTLDFTVNEPPIIELDVLLNRPTCTGMFDGSAVVEVSGGTGELTTIFEPSDLDILNQGDTSFTILNVGEGLIVITAFDENQCSVRDSIEVVPDIITDMIVNVYSSPETCWDSQDGTATVTVLYGNLPITYLWDDPSAQTTPIATNLVSSETYTVVVTDDIGCTLTSEVFVDPTIGCFFISTALTPNGDGANDFWVLGGLEFFPNAQIQVVNRWGQIVFESTGYNSPWDGSYRGELLPVADYYFVIDYSDDADPILGTVTIKY
jgi:gliding motility-associated-like protein